MEQDKTRGKGVMCDMSCLQGSYIGLSEGKVPDLGVPAGWQGMCWDRNNTYTAFCLSELVTWPHMTHGIYRIGAIYSGRQNRWRSFEMASAPKKPSGADDKLLVSADLGVPAGWQGMCWDGNNTYTAFCLSELVTWPHMTHRIYRIGAIYSGRQNRWRLFEMASAPKKPSGADDKLLVCQLRKKTACREPPYPKKVIVPQG
jgi:hypothetical protein